MYAITSEDGPEFCKDDEVLITSGMFAEQTAVVEGYDTEHDLYFVRTKDEDTTTVFAVFPSMLDPLDEDEDDDDDDEDEYEDDEEEDGEEELAHNGDRVVVMYGTFIGQAGVIEGEIPEWSESVGSLVLAVTLESGDQIGITATSLMLSPYQGDEEDAVDNEAVNHPEHYTTHPSGIECIQITEHMGFNLGNAVKYIWRADLKGNALQDLEKAAWYIEREIDRRNRNEGNA